MLTQNKNLLFIGEVSSQSGIPVKTIRYYEELGLLKSSGRTEGGFRQFAPEVLARLAFIKRTQNLGLSLQEIREFLDLFDQKAPPNSEIKQRLESEINYCNCRVQQLRKLQAELKELLKGVQKDCKTS